VCFCTNRFVTIRGKYREIETAHNKFLSSFKSDNKAPFRPFLSANLSREHSSPQQHNNIFFALHFHFVSQKLLTTLNWCRPKEFAVDKEAQELMKSFILRDKLLSEQNITLLRTSLLN